MIGAIYPLKPSPQFKSLLIHDVRVYRKNRVPDSQGGFIEEFVLQAEFKGRLRPASSTEKMRAAKWDSEISHVLYSLTDADIERSDIVRAGGNRVRVIAVREPSHIGHHFEIDCQEIQLEQKIPLYVSFSGAGAVTSEVVADLEVVGP